MTNPILITKWIEPCEHKLAGLFLFIIVLKGQGVGDMGRRSRPISRIKNSLPQTNKFVPYRRPCLGEGDNGLPLFRVGVRKAYLKNLLSIIDANNKKSPRCYPGTSHTK
jgi:hypothetical protein